MSRPSANPQGNSARRVEAPGPGNALEPAFQPPPAPANLSPEAAEVWTEVWLAGGSAYNPRTDARPIERYAELTARRITLLQKLDEEGWTTFGSMGQQAAHPLVRVLSDTEAKLQALEDRLGLNPEARIRLGIGAIERESKFREFMRDTD